MKVMRIILRLLVIVFIIIGLFSSFIAGIVMAMIPGVVLLFLPKSKKKQQEELIRKLQIEKLKKSL